MAKKSSKKRSSHRITKRLLDDVLLGKKEAFDTIAQIGTRAIGPLTERMQTQPPPPGIHLMDLIPNFEYAIALAAKQDAGPLIKEFKTNSSQGQSPLWLAYSALGDSKDKRVVEVLVEGLSDKSPYRREMALSALCRRRTPGITEHILPLICDRSSMVCFAAVSALLAHPEYRDERAIPFLERLLKRKRLETHSIGTKRRAEAVLAKIKSEQSANVLEHLDLSEEHVNLKQLQQIIAQHPLKSLNLTEARGVNNRVIEAVSEAAGLEELILCSFDVLELNLLPLGKLKKLKKLKLRNISIHGNNNAGVFAELPLLEYLTLGGCSQGDDELKPLRKLKHIRHLELDFHTTDAGFEHIRHLTGMERLGCSGYRVTSAALRSLERMKNLRDLDFFSCDVCKGSLEDLLALPRLEVLSLRYCHVTDEGLKTIGKMKQLRFLIVGHSKHITNRGIRQLKSLKNLEGLDLGVNALTDDAIETLIQLPNLKQLIHRKISKPGRKRLLAAHPEIRLNEFTLARTSGQR